MCEKCDALRAKWRQGGRNIAQGLIESLGLEAVMEHITARQQKFLGNEDPSMGLGLMVEADQGVLEWITDHAVLLGVTMPDAETFVVPDSRLKPATRH